MAATKVVEASDVVEDVKEIVEDGVELVEDSASWLSQNPKALVFGAILAGVAVGSAATYLVVSKKLAARYRAEANAEIEDVKSRYSLLAKEGENGDLEALAARYDDDPEVQEEIIEDQGYKAYDKVPPVEEEVVIETSPIAEALRDRNVFESDDPTKYFNFDEELQRREEHPDEPFVITRDEFMESESEQQSITYYEGDDVLADDADKPVDIDSLIGVANVLRFGHGSGDPKVVYIRNPKLDLDFEVVHSTGKFAKEVLGFDDGQDAELRHADRRPRRFRSFDD